MEYRHYDPRWMKMVRLLGQKQELSSRALAWRLGVNERTVSRLIGSGEKEGAEAGIRLEEKKGSVRLHVTDADRYRRFCAEALQMEEGRSSEMDYVILRLIQANDFVRIEQLAEEMFVSRATIDRMMKELKKEAEEYGLRIVQRPKYGIRIEGPETKKRSLCLSHGGGKQEQPDAQLALEVQGILLEVLEASGIRFNDINFYNLVYHCVIALRRIREGNYVEDQGEWQGGEGCEREEKAAQEIVRRFEERFGIRFPRGEIQYIVMYLLGKRVLESNRYISGECWDCVDAIVGEIREVYGISFAGDAELRTMLALHLEPLLTRLRLGQRQKNPLLAQIQREMKLGYELALCAAEVIQRRLNLTVTEDEAAYLALHFSLALEKAKQHAKRKKIIIVCASGRGTARLIQYKLMVRCQMKEEDLILSSVYELKEQDFDDCACVLCTFPIWKELPVPVLIVDPSMDEASMEKVEGFLRRDVQPGTGEERVLKSELVFLRESMPDKEAALRFLCGKLERAEGLTESFTENVFKREALSSTEVGGGLAMPHPYQYEGERTAAALLTLQRPILWNKGEVQAVLLVAYARSQDAAALWLGDAAAKLCMEPGYMERLLAAESYEEVCGILEEGEQ